MRIRKIGAAAVATALALVGLGAIAEGTAGAKGVVLQGTLSCVSGGSTAIIPGLVLAPANLPGYPAKPKDKKPKYITNGTGSACSGTTTSGTAPTSYTLTSKAKGDSRLIVNPNANCSAPGRAAKTKITFNQGAKVKVSAVSETSNYAYSVTGHPAQLNPPFPAQAPGTSVVFPPCGSSTNTAIAYAVFHGNDRIETRSSGTIPGNSKAYPGKVFKTRSMTTETLAAQLGASQMPNGVDLLHGDPAFSTATFGL